MKNSHELIKNLGKKQEEKQKEIKAYSEWPKCTRAGCPLMTTIKCDDLTCGYHFRLRGHEADCMTEAIKENMHLIKRYAAMLRWNVRTWQEKAPQIMGWPVLPATRAEIDFPTAYLMKFKKYMDQTIENRKEEIYKSTGDK